MLQQLLAGILCVYMVAVYISWGVAPLLFDVSLGRRIFITFMKEIFLPKQLATPWYPIWQSLQTSKA
jgi:hypothetical protein